MRAGKILVLIVDDDPLAREFIRRLLDDDSDIEVIGECADSREAVAAISALKPNLVFLDVQMPGTDGLTMLEELGVELMPRIILTTAHRHYALRAFELHALDYLLKPFDQVRFSKAMNHVKQQFLHPHSNEEWQQVAALVESVEQKLEYFQRLIVKSNGRLLFLKTEEISWIEADDKHVHLHLPESSYTIRQTMRTLESRLNPKQFIRIHRSTIVNIGFIREFSFLLTGEPTLLLDDGTQLMVGPGYKDNLSSFLGESLEPY
jgi:two-component system LytT family response regulator